MQVEKHKIDSHNSDLLAQHKRKLDFVAADVPDAKSVIQKLKDFQVADRKSVV